MNVEKPEPKWDPAVSDASQKERRRKKELTFQFSRKWQSRTTTERKKLESVSSFWRRARIRKRERMAVIKNAK